MRAVWAIARSPRGRRTTITIIFDSTALALPAQSYLCIQFRKSPGEGFPDKSNFIELSNFTFIKKYL
jgi:hypothetical protein